MNGHEIELRNGEELTRFVRALGQHRYISSHLHLVHAFAVHAASTTKDLGLERATQWAKEVLADRDIDPSSKDERLYFRASDAELVTVLGAFFLPGPSRDRALIQLASSLARIDAMPRDLDVEPFDEGREEDMFPILIDAGWELLPLRALDPERHAGAIRAIGDTLAFDCAKFEEENAAPEGAVTLYELPALGAVELLAGVDDKGFRAPFVLWTSGHDAYLDYVLRGVRKVAKLDGP